MNTIREFVEQNNIPEILLDVQNREYILLSAVLVLISIFMWCFGHSKESVPKERSLKSRGRSPSREYHSCLSESPEKDSHSLFFEDDINKQELLKNMRRFIENRTDGSLSEEDRYRILIAYSEIIPHIPVGSPPMKTILKVLSEKLDIQPGLKLSTPTRMASKNSPLQSPINFRDEQLIEELFEKYVE